MSWFCDFIHICPTQLLLHDNLLSTLGNMHKSDVVLHDVSFRYAACQQCMWLYESSVTCMCSLVMFMCACVCVFWVTRSYLFVVWVDGDIVPQRHVLWNMLAAFVASLPVLLFWHFHTMVHLNTLMLLSLSNYYSLNSSSQERLASQCRIHGTRFIVEEQQQGLTATRKQKVTTEPPLTLIIAALCLYG